MNIYCRNCGKKGHKYKDCFHPRLSYGIILFNEKQEIIMIERKDSISYIEFIRGKYYIEQSEYIQLLINRMNILEKNKLEKYSFKELWTDICFSNNNKEYEGCCEKYNNIDIKSYLEKTKYNYKYNEWEIPKGRRNLNESNKCCAIREFEEETNIKLDEYDIYDNIIPLEEEYIGSNGERYKNVYYIGKIKNNNKELTIDYENNNQISEIKSIQWLNKKECIERIREYSDYKLNIIEKIFKFIHSDKNNIIL